MPHLLSYAFDRSLSLKLGKAQSRINAFRNDPSSSSADASKLIAMMQQAIAGLNDDSSSSGDQPKSPGSVQSVASEIYEGLNLILNSVKQSDDDKTKLTSALQASKSDHESTKQQLASMTENCQNLTQEVETVKAKSAMCEEAAEEEEVSLEFDVHFVLVTSLRFS